MKERIMPENSVRVFFNEDCGKYGVEVFDKGTTSGWLGWRQVDTTKYGATDVYTRYKKVAERWRVAFMTHGERVQR